MSDDLANGTTNRGPTYRVPRSGMDPATKRLALIAAGLGGALFVVVGAWSTIGGRSNTVPVIAAPATPIRVKPANPGGMKVANDLILAGKSADSGTDTLAPAPEAPDPQALKTHRAPPAAPTATSAPKPAVATAQSVPLPTPPLSAPTAVAKHEIAKTEPPKPAPAPPVRASGHGAQVQLASLPTREAAEEEWRRLARRDANLLTGRSPAITESTVNGRIWWRVRTGGFADEAQAKEFCEKFRTSGEACTVARF